MTTNIPVLFPGSELRFTGLTQREHMRIADRAYRRAHHTGLPLSQMLRSETARFALKHSYRGEASMPGDFEHGKASFDAVADSVAKQPGHEAADAVSAMPSPIPEERAETIAEEEAAERKASMDAAEKPKRPSKAKAETPAPEATPLPTPKPTAEALAAAEEKSVNVGKRVSWKMVGKDYAGTIKHVIPEGATPKSLGIEAGTDKPRTGHSYVVEIEGTGKLSWPMLNTLTMLD